jgi:hypothetical protein
MLEVALDPLGLPLNAALVPRRSLDQFAAWPWLGRAS